MTTTQQPVTGKGRGFASMDAETKKSIASKGGKAAHANGTAHKWDSREASLAGQKGGKVSRRGSTKPKA